MGEPTPEPELPERRADAAHRGYGGSLVPAPAADEPSPSLELLSAGAAVEVVERLEQLDDLVFEAIAGKPAALDQLRTAWPAALRELEPALLDESRSQYLRHAMTVWKNCIASEEIVNPRLAIAAIDVVTILLGG